MLTMRMDVEKNKLFRFLPSFYLSGNWAAAAPLSGSGEQDVIQL